MGLSLCVCVSLFYSARSDQVGGSVEDESNFKPVRGCVCVCVRWGGQKQQVTQTHGLFPSLQTHRVHLTSCP